MAYQMTSIKRKDGSITYQIFSVDRIPGGGNKQKWTRLEKLSPEYAAENGIKDLKAYADERLESWKKTNTEEAEYATVKIPLYRRLLENPEETVNLGHAVYSLIYHRLGLDYLINMRRQHTNADYNANAILQHLLYSRCLWPASKKATWEIRSVFGYSTDYCRDSVYRCMDDILKWRTDILEHLNGKIKELYGRKSTVVFYDVTNYYFERDDDDDEEGLRARGVSKEHRPEPIIQMGLFMDELGLPITYELFRGNRPDSTTLAPAMDESIIDFSDSRKIVVADKGMMTYFNILKIRDAENGYVISQSIRKSDEETVNFALDGKDWTEKKDKNGTLLYKYKERDTVRTARSYGLKDDSRHTGRYNERQVFIWSRKYSDRAKAQRQNALNKANMLAGHTSKDGNDTKYGSAKYLKKVPVIEGKETDAEEYRYVFDEKVLAEEEKLDGYYILCTNVVGAETPDDSKPYDHAFYRNDGFLVLNHAVTSENIVEIYGGLWKIEETFKVTKTGMLNLRPVFHSRQDRIRAHFLICFLSLVLERVLEYELNWKYSSSFIQNCLSRLNALKIADSNVLQTYGYSDGAGDIFLKMGISLPGTHFRQSDLRKLFASVKKTEKKPVTQLCSSEATI